MVKIVNDHALRFPHTETGDAELLQTCYDYSERVKTNNNMANYRLTPDAKSDLIDIRRYTVEQWGKTQSKKYLSELRQTIRLLTETPSLGKSRPDVGEDVLSFPHVSHVIYYMIHERQLVVFGVLHKRMVPVNHLDGREVI